MTSNIGSHYLLDAIKEDCTISDKQRELVMNELKARFKPEFLNRIDEIVMFKPLSKQEILKIIDLSIFDIQKRLNDRRIIINVSQEAKEFIARNAYSPVYGARPVKRYLQKHIETEIAKKIISGEINEDGKIEIKLNSSKNGFEYVCLQ
jgi:ATP-dependent Clp protease ATP-binding subunit ClpB